MASEGKLICSFPGPSIEVPNSVFNDDNFLSELVNFLVHMNDDDLSDAAATMPQKENSDALEVRDTTHPRYITELLTGILRSVGRPADITRISKRVGDDVRVVSGRLELPRPWRRSPLWLLIRVVLQTTLGRSILGRVAYKEFMLLFMCCLAKERITAELSNDLLQFMSAKISRRLQKLGSSASDWLSHIVLETCTSLRSTLEKRWSRVQAAQHVSPSWRVSQLDLNQDIQLSLLRSSDYLRNSLADQRAGSHNAGFSPKHHPRGCLNEFLSSDGVFFEEAYRAEPHVALYDVERAVEQEIDGWVDHVTKNDDACVQLEILATKYSSAALKTYGDNPELLSVVRLTTIELWVALDKIAIREIPMLADYSPVVPTSLLEDLLVCKATSLNRLLYAHQYLFHRHSQSHHGLPVFSQEITADTFAVRYYRGSVRLQHLRSQIEEAAQREVDEKVVELENANTQYAKLQRQASGIQHTHSKFWSKYTLGSGNCRKCNLEDQQRRMEITIHEWPLPAERLEAEVVVFELDCPVSFNMWHAAIFHLLTSLCPLQPGSQHTPKTTLGEYDLLKPCLVPHAQSRLTLGSDTTPFFSGGTVSLPASVVKAWA